MNNSFSSYKSQILKDNRSQKLIFDIDGRNHYVYRISNLETDKHYYGSRVTILNPTLDIGIKYFSSSSIKKFISEQKKYPHNFKYKIIRITNNSGDNIIFESYIHQYFQVNKNEKFYNLSNQTPFGWSVTGNKASTIKCKETRSKIDPETNLNSYQLSHIKCKETRSKIDPETNLNSYQSGGLLCKEILSKNDPETGLTGYQKSNIKMLETRSKIDPETNLNSFQSGGLITKKTMNLIDPETGLTGYQKSNIKMLETRSKIDPETNLNSYQTGSLSCKERRSKIDPETNLNSYQTQALTISGKNSHNFKGYYIIKNKKYITSGQATIETGISSSSIRNWCTIKNNIKITNITYNKSKFIQSLGPKENIVGKTFKEIGFSFEPKSQHT